MIINARVDDPVPIIIIIFLEPRSMRPAEEGMMLLLLVLVDFLSIDL